MERIDVFPQNKEGELNAALGYVYVNLDSLLLTEKLALHGVTDCHIEEVSTPSGNRVPKYIWYKKTLVINNKGQLCIDDKIEHLV